MHGPRKSISPIEVLIFACSLSMVTYLDRACFALAGGSIIEDLKLDGDQGLKWPFTLFTLAYAVFEIPSGWLGDTYGPRKALLRIVLAWSLFTALTGAVGLKVGGVVLGGLATMCVIRFLFGMGEAGAYPNLARAVANWFPPHERARVKGWIWMSGRLMGGLTPMVWAVLVAGTEYTQPLMNWRGAFLVFGLVGVVWCVAFALRFQDSPPGASHAVVSSAQPALSAGSFFGHMLRDSNLWMIGLMYACGAFGWYFNITYFPRYLAARYAVKPGSIETAIFQGGPLLLGAIGCLAGGYWSDALLRTSVGHRWARRIPAMIGHALCGICYLAAVWAPSALLASLSISLAAFGNDLMMGPAWATCQDIGGRRTAVVSGWMNTLGNLGGTLSPLVVGSILGRVAASRAAELGVAENAMSATDATAAAIAGYQSSLLIFSAVSFVAVLTWFVINAERHVKT